jgi:hypothetical protein
MTANDGVFAAGAANGESLDAYFARLAGFDAERQTTEAFLPNAARVQTSPRRGTCSPSLAAKNRVNNPLPFVRPAGGVGETGANPSPCQAQGRRPAQRR